jgi:substrate import-associated zinc metallohydrolase lipoprotein
VNLEDDEWLDLGFITDYASRETQEDFVELIANYVTHDQAWWDGELAKASKEGKAAIETKLDIVRDWLKTSWEIDLDALREIVQRRSANVKLLDLQTLN